jgi:Tfp pilus assembly protein PilN
VTRRPFNLASRPFRNETLPRLLLGLGFVVLLAGSVVHALAVRRLLPAHTSARHEEARELETRLARLEARTSEFKREVSEATLAEWQFVKDMVDRRAFSWTRLLRDLEESLPEGVRVTSLAPDVEDERLVLTLEAQVRTPEDGLELVRRLEGRPEFEHVDPQSTTEVEGGERVLRLKMEYTPAPESPEPPPAGRRQKAAARAAEEQP